MRRLGLMLVLVACGFSAAVQAAPADKVEAATGVTFQSVSFFNGKHFQFDGCQAKGHNQTRFSNQAVHIYALVSYSSWVGKHTEQYFWYEPTGALWDKGTPTPYTDNGPTYSCSYMDLAGEGGFGAIGTWTFQVRVDGQAAGTGHFQVVRPGASVTPASSPTSTAPAAGTCALQSGMNYYNWRLWQLLSGINTYEDKNLDNGSDAAYTYVTGVDKQDHAIWDAVGTYEQKHPANWKAVDMALLKVVNDVIHAGDLLYQDAQTEETSSGGLIFLKASKAVMQGYADQAAAKQAIAALACPKTAPASTGATAKPKVTPQPARGSSTSGPYAQLQGDCFSYRNQMWALNQETSRDYAWFSQTLGDFHAGSISPSTAVHTFGQIARRLDGGHPLGIDGNGLMHRITVTSYHYGIREWARRSGPFAWASSKVFYAAIDLDSVAYGMATGGPDPDQTLKIYQKILNEGVANLGYAWDALKQLPCHAAPTTTPAKPRPTPAPRPTAVPTQPVPSAAHFQVRAWVSPSSMPYDYYPTLYAQTTPGATCSASVVYTTGRSPVSFGGEPQRVGASGKVGWSWHEETEGSGGTATVTCSLAGKSVTATADFSVG